MPLVYPPVIVGKDFKDGGSLAQAAKRGTQDRPAMGLNSCAPVKQPTSELPQRMCAVTSITIQAGGKVSKSFQKRNHKSIPSDDAGRVNFAPKLETATIDWVVENPDLVTSAKIEIFRRGHSTPLWSQTNAKFDLASCTLDYNGAATATRLFPKRFLNVEHGPYKLKITIEGPARPGCTEAFTYFDVVIHSITLTWGQYTQLRRRRKIITPENVNAILGVPNSGVKGYEELAFDSITNLNPAPGPGLQHQVPLVCNIFAKKPPGTMEIEEYVQRDDFTLYKDMWGTGARIPILAKVLVKMADGVTGTDQAPEALAGCRLLWDWQDHPDLRSWRVGLTPTAKTEDYLRDIFSQNAAALPKNVPNCPKELGGKLGDSTEPIFRTTSGSGIFPYTVDACGTRTWAAFSKFPTSGTSAAQCSTGVIFHPSRIAGDRYQVSCALYFDPSMDSTDDLDIAPPAKAEAGTFEVFKKTILNYLVRGGTADLGCDPAAIQATIKDTYLKECKTIVDVQQIAIDNTVYKQALKAALVEVEKRPDAYNQIELMPLIARHLVDLDPAANSPGVMLKKKEDFIASLETAFKNGRLRLVTVGGMLPGEEIVGQISGTKGIPIATATTKGDAPTFVLVDAGKEFSNVEMVKGQASKKLASATASPVKSCWGHMFLEVVSPASRYDAAVDVGFSGQSVTVKYARTGIKRRIVTTLSNAAWQDLEDAFALAGAAFNESQQLIITITHKGKDTGRHPERITNLKTAIDEILITGRGMIDRQAYWNKLKLDGWGILSSEPDYRQRFQKFFVDTLLIQGVVEEYVKLNHQNDKGIFLLHIPGRNNARDLPELSKNFSDLAVTGAFYGDVFVNDRAKAVTYIATLDPNGTMMYKEDLKSVPSIFAHEAGHAIFLPHAPTVNLQSTDPTRTKEGCHVKGDNCLMNYDVDSEHFCGVCMLRMRGWDWQPLPNSLGEQEYQLRLEMDDVDTLFSAPVTSPAGIKERLQVMGMLNRPLNHPEIDDCLDFSWPHFDEVALHSDVSIDELYGGQCDPVSLALLKQMVTEFLVEEGQLPDPGDFAKIRAPGGFGAMYSQNYLEATMWENEGKPAAKPYETFMLGADRFQAETAFYTANPALGKIPLKATVRRRVKGSTDPWTLMARKAKVYFQLVTPDDISGAPDDDSEFIEVVGGKTYHTGVKAPALNATPLAYYQKKVEKHKPAAGDPDEKNVHQDLGGKRGGTVFVKPRSQGFTEIPFDTKTKFASAVETDDNGVARIVFCPSVIGGDTYKLRVFVGPPTQDTTFGGADIAETGTMVRWRSVRVCQDIVMAPAADATEAPAESCKKADGSLMPNVAQYLGDLPELDLTTVSMEMAKSFCELVIEPAAEEPVAISEYSGHIKAMAISLASDYPRFNSTAYAGVSIHREPMAVVLGSGDRRFRVVLQTPPEKKSVTVRPKGGGIDAALALDESGDIVTRDPAIFASIDYNTGEVIARFSPAQTRKEFDVCYHPAKYIDIDEILDFPDTSPFLFNLALPRIYNTRIRGNNRIRGQIKPVPVNLADETERPGALHDFIDARKLGFVKALLMDAAVRGVNLNGGFYPGLIFFRAHRADNYTSIWPTGSQEGKGVGNGIFLFGGAGDAAFKALTIHEMSHGLLLMHAPTAPGYRVKEHDPDDVNCVMSYDPNDGDHCGLCSAALRGINIRLNPQFP